nr:sulfur carrier protein ThiS [Candidatus Pandoraea novymonadis]
MKIHINNETLTVRDSLTLAEALANYGAKSPFSAAINGFFVPKEQYGARILAPGDTVDVVQPVVGG